MALLAQPKRKEKYGFDPRNTTWASDDSKFGQKLMEKMGWEKGKGLGANEDGNVEHIKASYKSDTRGLGCTVKQADAWVAHQDDFNDLLRKLNEGSAEQEKVTTPKDEAQEGRKRYHGRFARGRVQTLRTTDDLDCIMGRRKTSEPSTPANQSARNSDDEVKDCDRESELKHVTSSCSVQEYFANKMKALKARRSAAESPVVKEEGVKPADNTSSDKPTPVYGTVQFSYGDGDKSPSNADGGERNCYNNSDGQEMEEVKREKKKKKKKKKDKSDEGGDCVNELDNKREKVKKRKHKLESSSCEDEQNSAQCTSQADDVQEVLEKEGTGDDDRCSKKKKKSKSKRKKELDKSCEIDNLGGDSTSDLLERKESEIPQRKKRKRVEEDEVETCIPKTKKKRSKKDNIDMIKEEVIDNITDPSEGKREKKTKKKSGEDVCENELQEKKKKKKDKLEPVENDNKMEDSASSCNTVSAEHPVVDESAEKINAAKEKKKSKRKRSQQNSERKKLNGSFPGSNFGEIEGYVHISQGSS